MMINITQLYEGSLKTLQPEGQKTGIFKHPVGSAEVVDNGFTRDHQADRRVHGGPEKAIHQYAVQSYDAIVSEYPELAGIAVAGSMGENISSPDLADASVCIGDIYRFGDVLLQVSQPRRPCWKINHKFGIESLSMFIEQARITGWYYRVLEAGTTKTGDEITLFERPNEGISISHFTDITTQHRPDLEQLAVLAVSKGLSPEWARRLEKRHAYLKTLVQGQGSHP